MIEDEDLLLGVLNSTPVVDGAPTDVLAGAHGDALVARHGGTGTPAERRRLAEVRDRLQAVVRGTSGAAAALAPELDAIALRPELLDRPGPDREGGGPGRFVRWRLAATGDGLLAARVLLAWTRVESELPGRIRPCQSGDCDLFLLDRSRPGTARWCSMATCGNRAKARAHAERRRRAAVGGD